MIGDYWWDCWKSGFQSNNWWDSRNEPKEIQMYKAKDVRVDFHCVATTFKNHTWEVEIRLHGGIFGHESHKPVALGRVYVQDDLGELTPARAYNLAVEQILSITGDANWRPTLAHQD